MRKQKKKKKKKKENFAFFCFGLKREQNKSYFKIPDYK
jgi:hypothetical protein